MFQPEWESLSQFCARSVKEHDNNQPHDWCKLRPAPIRVYPVAMLIVHVHVHVKPEYVEAFKAATIENARHSVREPGIAGFDLVQHQDDPEKFVLVEAYRTPDAPAAHKETVHYKTWRDTVASMMAEPRASVKYTNLFPDDARW